MSKRRTYDRAERYGQIIQAIHVLGGPVRERQIADEIQLVKSEHTRALLDDLVQSGIALQSVVTLRNGLRAYTYSLDYDRIIKQHPELAKELDNVRSFLEHYS